MSDDKREGFFTRLLHPGKPDSIEDLEGVIDDARKRRIISSNTEDMIRGVFDMGRQRVSEIMIPRSEMITMPSDATVVEAARTVAETGHSRYPVISGDKDHIEGILLAKDLLSPLAGLTTVDGIKPLLRKAVIVPESKRVSAMLKDFQNQRFHLAVVVDEFGGVSGLVTIEDILELIVGDIDDEYDDDDGDEDPPMIAKARESNTYIVNGLTPIDDFEDYFKLKLPEVGVDTIAGLVLHVLGYFPKTGTKLTIGRFDIEILSAGAQRIKLLRFVDLGDER